MITFRTIIFVPIILIVVGCDYIASKIPFVGYENHSMIFEYPFYWEIIEDPINEGHDLITIAGPLGSTIALTISPLKGAFSLEEYSRNFSESFKENVEVLNVTKATFTPAQDKIGNYSLTGVREVFAINFLGEEVQMRRDYFLINRDNDVVYMVFQTDGEAEFEAEQIEKIKQSFVFQ
jgi:hypothetical protein